MSKKGFMDGYKRYDPAREGYGSARQWRGDFHERMGFDEAKATVKDDSPFSILGVSERAGWSEIKTAYRRLAMLWHPDKYQTTTIALREEAEEKMKRINAAYVVLEHQFGKA